MHRHVPRITFAKYQGLGNDFIIVRAEAQMVTAAAAARLCDRRRGIGADGVLSLLAARTPDAAARMHVFNADGSVAEMCGNGLRCVVRYLLGPDGGERLIVDTDDGPKQGWAVQEHVAVTLGTARLIADEIVVDGSEPGMGVSMGNPHLVLPPVTAGDDPMVAARTRGPALERHPAFPERVNVGFTDVQAPDRLRLVVFERGSGITDACGTGAGAAVTALARRGLLDPARPVTVELPGGPLQVELTEDPRRSAVPGDALTEVVIVGEARWVFDGSVDLADDDLQPITQA